MLNAATVFFLVFLSEDCRPVPFSINGFIFEIFQSLFPRAEGDIFKCIMLNVPDLLSKF